MRAKELHERAARLAMRVSNRRGFAITRTCDGHVDVIIGVHFECAGKTASAGLRVDDKDIADQWAKDWLAQKYRELVEETAKHISGPCECVAFGASPNSI